MRKQKGVSETIEMKMCVFCLHISYHNLNRVELS